MRWIIRLIGGVIALIVLAVVVISLIPAEKIAALATREISERTGREVVFTGKIKPVFFPVLGVKTGAFSVGNADWSDGTPMLVADSLLVGVELSPLLAGEVRIKEFRINGPKILLERASDGQVNWALEPDGADAGTATVNDASTATELPAFSLKEGKITQGSITFVDHGAGATYALNSLDLTASVPDLAGPVTLSGKIEYSGQKMSFTAGISELATLIGGQLVELNADVSGEMGKVSFSGRAGIDPMVAEGDLNMDIQNLTAATKLAGQNDITSSFGNSGALTGALTYAEDGNIYLRDAVLLLGSNRIAGDLDIELDDVPNLTAKLVAGDLDFSRMSANESAETSAHTAQSGWSKTAMDFGALHLLNADVAFLAASVDLGVVKLDETRLRLRLDRGRLVIGLDPIAAYGGKISGEFVVNSRGGLSMGGDLVARDLQLQPLLIDMADNDRLIAGASGNLEFLTSGTSMDAMMRRLSGSGRMDIGAGELLGLDLMGMLRNLDGSFRGEGSKTIFSEISGSYQIADGVLVNDDLDFRSGLVDATGEGQVDIGAQTVTYRLVPVAFSGQEIEEAGGISVPVLIDGPWSNLRYRPDLQGLFDAELDKQRKELEAKVTEEIEKAQKDAEERLKEEADKAIQKALDDALNRLIGND